MRISIVGSGYVGLVSGAGLSDVGHHVVCMDIDELNGCATAIGIERITRRANGEALFQVFLKDPNGVKIELNFPAEEAEGVAPELMASDFLAS